jgi:hypothetical protein
MLRAGWLAGSVGERLNLSDRDFQILVRKCPDQLMHMADQRDPLVTLPSPRPLYFEELAN